MHNWIHLSRLEYIKVDASIYHKIGTTHWTHELFRTTNLLYFVLLLLMYDKIYEICSTTLKIKVTCHIHLVVERAGNTILSVYIYVQRRSQFNIKAIQIRLVLLKQAPLQCFHLLSLHWVLIFDWHNIK